MVDLIGQTLGQYQILEEIGRGGMALVYKGYDAAREHEVAIKVLASHLVGEQGLVERFIREGKTAASLKHPHIVTIYNVGEQDGIYYFVMEYLEGPTLAEVIQQEGALPPQRVARIAEQVASALDYAHAQGLVHRDIKSRNIIMGPGDQATLTDFGIVKALADTSLTHPGTFIGTPEYVSPEQARGQDVDHRSDIYSLGVVCYEMLSGRVPFVGDIMAVLHAHAYETPPPLRSLNPSVPPALEAVIGKALAKEAMERHQSAGELARALAVAASGVSPPPQTAPAPEPETVIAPPGAIRLEPTRKRFPRTLIGVIFLGLAAVIIAWLILDGEPLPKLVVSEASPTPTRKRPTPKATPTATRVPPTPTPGPPTETPLPTAPPGMVYVPAGEFTMGSDREDDEQPVHKVYLDAFYIDKYEVTNAQYRECVEVGECSQPHDTAWYNDPNRAETPVVYVDWHQAEAYCEWTGKRLPTEAEWEYAARGPEGQLFPWGDVFDGSRLNYCDANCEFDWADETVDDGYANTAPVGSYPTGACWCGMLDMAGNAWEWLADWYDSVYYRQSPDRNPPGPDSGEYRVLRGGSWLDGPNLMPSTTRYRNHPNDARANVGFRCAGDSE